MTDRWAKYGMDVCGPVALDLAVSPEACRHKHYSAPGAGMADILLVPNYEVGNGIGKGRHPIRRGQNAGVILGAKVPIVLVSRSDSAYSKLVPSPPAASCPGGCTCPDQTAYIEESMLW